MTTLDRGPMDRATPGGPPDRDGGRGGPGAPPLRILHVSEVHSGGVVTLLDHFMVQQRLAGHEVHLLAPAGPGAWGGPEFHEWVFDRDNPRTTLIALRQLRWAVEKVDPDVIHLHSFFAGLLGRLPLSVPGRGRTPIVYQPHAWSTDLFPQRSRSWAVGAVERQGSRRADLLVGNCTDELQQGIRLGVRLPGRPLGVTVDLEQFVPPRDRAEKDEQKRLLGLGTERLAIVVGRIARQKGQDLLLPAWERHHPRDTVLGLIGPGDLGSMAALAPQEWNRSVRGFGASNDVAAWMRAADLLVLPSRYETVGLVVAEAMAMGLPVVATRVDGAPETIIDGPVPSAGAVVDINDMDALIEAVERRLTDADLWAAESSAARVRAESMFRPDTVAARLEGAYRDAITLKHARSRTDMSGPNFLVVGGARCGTTGLVEGLRDHPQVFVTDPKEPHYFALHKTGAQFAAPGDAHTINKVAVTDRDAYFDLYPKDHDYLALGDASVSSLYYHQDAIPEITATNPDMKIVVLLREPIARAYSAHQYMRARGLEPVEDFLEAVALEDERREAGWHHIWHYTAMSKYAEAIAAYQAAFPAEQLGIWFYDDLNADYERTIGEIFRFLDVPMVQGEGEGVPRVNISGQPRYALVHAALGAATGNERVRTAVKCATSYRFRERVRRAVLQRNGLSPEIFAALTPVFAEDLNRLGGLLSQPMPRWLHEAIAA